MKKSAVSIVLSILVLSVFGLPRAVSASGCVCIVQGEITAAQCVVVVAKEECQATGQFLAESKRQSVQCTLYTDDACTASNPLSLDRIATPTAPASDSTMLGGGGSMGPGTTVQPPVRNTPSSSAPPGFPEPKIIIPELNIKIPGLTNFVEPHPAECPESLSSIGITSCKNFPWIGQYISAFYNFGIAIAAFLAVVLIMWGGFLYITASGISSQAEKGKSFIQGAFLGLVIVFSSYIMLATINPDLVKFHGLVVPDVPSRGSISGAVDLPRVVDEGYEERGEVEDGDVIASGSAQEQPLDPFQGSGTLASSSSTSTTQSPTSQPRPAARTIDCKKEPPTDPCPNCPTLPTASFSANNVTYKGVKSQKDQPCQRRTDQVTLEMNTVMQKIIARLNETGPASVIGAWQVTEAWPPTVPHDSSCHKRGCAIDLVILGAKGENDPRVIAMEKVLREFLQPGGLGCVLNEYRVRTNKRTGPHFHIELGKCRIH